MAGKKQKEIKSVLLIKRTLVISMASVKKMKLLHSIAIAYQCLLVLTLIIISH